MNKTLDVHTAELITAAVEVKTLTIRGKQVTLAVFRQLEEKPLLLENGTLAGIPWGRVNYHPDKCADGQAHMHVVWQEGSELRRSWVRTLPTFGLFLPSGEDDEINYVSLQYARCATGLENEFWVGRFQNYDSTFNFVEVPTVEIEITVDSKLLRFPDLPSIESYQLRADTLGDLLSLDPLKDQSERAAEQAEMDRNHLIGSGYRGYVHVHVRAPLGGRIECARRDLVSAVDNAHGAALALHEYLLAAGWPSLNEARAALLAQVVQEHDRRERIRSTTAMLAELSQLFIAV